MPFDSFVQHAFSLLSVQRNAPALSGVYGLSNARDWLLVGETDDIKAALLSHLQETHTPLLEREPTGFVFELCVSNERVARQERLIQDYQPIVNWRPPEYQEHRRKFAPGRLLRVVSQVLHAFSGVQEPASAESRDCVDRG